MKKPYKDQSRLLSDGRCATRLIGGRCIRTDDHEREDCYAVTPDAQSGDVK